MSKKMEDVRLAAAALLHPIIKPWAFREFGFDFVGKIHISSSRGHYFVIVATNY